MEVNIFVRKMRKKMKMEESGKKKGISKKSQHTINLKNDGYYETGNKNFIIIIKIAYFLI